MIVSMSHGPFIVGWGTGLDRQLESQNGVRGGGQAVYQAITIR